MHWHISLLTANGILIQILPSVLWHCWLGVRKSICW